MKIGDLVKFDYVNGHTRAINNKVGIYLGPRPHKREDGNSGVKIKAAQPLWSKVPFLAR